MLGLDVVPDSGLASGSCLCAAVPQPLLPISLLAHGRVLNVDPPVISVQGFLTHEECDAITKAAEGERRQMQRLNVAMAHGARAPCGGHLRMAYRNGNGGHPT